MNCMLCGLNDAEAPIIKIAVDSAGNDICTCPDCLQEMLQYVRDVKGED